MSRLAKLIARSLQERPEDWSYDSLSKPGSLILKHVSGGVLWWTADRRKDFLIRNLSWPLGMVGEVSIWLALRSWMRCHPNLQIQQPTAADFGLDVGAKRHMTNLPS